MTNETKNTKETAETKKETKKEEEKPKDDQGRPLTKSDIEILRRYGKGPYNDAIKKADEDIKTFNQKISALCGIRESDTGLALPAQWNLAQDAQMLK
jgi:26S proteasome regulatory subunit T1